MLLVLGHRLGLGPAPESQEKHLSTSTHPMELRITGLPKPWKVQVSIWSGLGEHELPRRNPGHGLTAVSTYHMPHVVLSQVFPWTLPLAQGLGCRIPH